MLRLSDATSQISYDSLCGGARAFPRIANLENDTEIIKQRSPLQYVCLVHVCLMRFILPKPETADTATSAEKTTFSTFYDVRPLNKSSESCIFYHS